MALQLAANEEEDNERIEGDLSRYKKPRETSAYHEVASWKTTGMRDMVDESVRLVTEQPVWETEDNDKCGCLFCHYTVRKDNGRNQWVRSQVNRFLNRLSGWQRGGSPGEVRLLSVTKESTLKLFIPVVSSNKICPSSIKNYPSSRPLNAVSHPIDGVIVKLLLNSHPVFLHICLYPQN